MENEKYVGKGWANQYGVKVQVKKQDLLDLPTNQYGDIEVFVGQRKEVDQKSKATHWVKWKAKDAPIQQASNIEIHPALTKAVNTMANHGWTPEDDGLPF
jgi:hypothetical protein